MVEQDRFPELDQGCVSEKPGAEVGIAPRFRIRICGGGLDLINSKSTGDSETEHLYPEEGIEPLP